MTVCVLTVSVEAKSTLKAGAVAVRQSFGRWTLKTTVSEVVNGPRKASLLFVPARQVPPTEVVVVTPVAAVPLTQIASGMDLESGKSMYEQLFEAPEAVQTCPAAAAAEAAVTTFATATPESDVVLLDAAACTKFPLV